MSVTAAIFDDEFSDPDEGVEVGEAYVTVIPDAGEIELLLTLDAVDQDTGMRCIGKQPGSGGFIKTIRLIKRLATEMPQPARALSWLVPSCFISGLLIYVLTRQFWPSRVAFGAAGVFLFLFGLCVFRDINGAASSWSRMYRESRGLSPEQFTFADVPTLKGMGFMYMLMAVFWLGLAILAM